MFHTQLLALVASSNGILCVHLLCIPYFSIWVVCALRQALLFLHRKCHESEASIFHPRFQPMFSLERDDPYGIRPICLHPILCIMHGYCTYLLILALHQYVQIQAKISYTGIQQKSDYQFVNDLALAAPDIHLATLMVDYWFYIPVSITQQN